MQLRFRECSKTELHRNCKNIYENYVNHNFLAVSRVDEPETGFFPRSVQLSTNELLSAEMSQIYMADDSIGTSGLLTKSLFLHCPKHNRFIIVGLTRSWRS